MLPGSPKPGDYDLVNVGPYRIHQRCAEKFRVGRITIAADAAHLCNPFGGMGLTGGIVDVGGLADCLVGIETGQADESILDKYDEVRRHIYKTLIDTISSGNFIRVSSDTAEAEAKDEMIQMIKKGNEDPEVKKEMDAVRLSQKEFTRTNSHLDALRDLPRLHTVLQVLACISIKFYTRPKISNLGLLLLILSSFFLHFSLSSCRQCVIDHAITCAQIVDRII